ncbi:DUF3999 family protein [Planctomyces sp. SH-PL62]|uniref:DUF3999 family protein n=1 Tax=Planctomyces sp. SH-PL62 TaxID=1636152 RepID=UPI00078D4546|nr:DUF3999 family protein [Planctomyces sp. SH-PL62]AMV40315.1 hypothetical protein VT85_22985 [Planctomyces sp. SH-PL62]
MTATLAARIRPGLLVVLALAATGAAADSRLRFTRDLAREGRGDAVLVAPLDAPVFAEARDGFPDLRVYDDRGGEVPYDLERAVWRRTVSAHEPAASRVVSLEVVEGEAIEIVVKLDDDAPEPDGATVRTPLNDFERRVRVLGSADGRTWTPLVDDARIFDYSRFMDVRDVDVPFPPRGFRWFKLIVEREADESRSPYYELSRSRIEGERERRTEVERILRRPFRIDRIDLFRTVERTTEEEPAMIRDQLDVLKVETDRRERVTRIDVAGGRLPLLRLALRTSSRNFNRPARVLAPAPGGAIERWAEIGRGTLYLYQIEGFRREHLALDVVESRADRLRIIIDDGDNPPLDVLGVDGDRADLRLAFIGEEGRTYRLAYGSDALDPPRYDAAAVLAALGPRHPRETVALGPPIPNADHRPSSRPWGDGATWLTLALILMTAVLAWAVVQAVRRVDKAPTDDFDG